MKDKYTKREYKCTECGFILPRMGQVSGAHIVIRADRSEYTCFGSACFKPGLYRLLADVKAPHPDGRATFRSEWKKQKVWKAGTEFLVRQGANDVNIAPRDENFWYAYAVNATAHGDDYLVLLGALSDGILVPFEEKTVDSIVDRLEVSAKDILNEMISKGVITFDKVLETAEALYAADEPKD